MQTLAEGLWSLDSGHPGRAVALSFGVHGNERPPLDAGLRLVEQFQSGELSLRGGRLLLIFGNPRAAAEDQRWSKGGVDLNRCFHEDTLAREPALYEQGRAQEIARHLEAAQAEVLVDFHCTVEPGTRFLVQHPSVSEPRSQEVYSLLRAEVLLSDPSLNFGAVSLDEYMSTRNRVGICYETGWIKDPKNTPVAVLEEMHNVLAGLGLIDGNAKTHASKTLLTLDEVLCCEGDGFAWEPGIGENLQALPAATVLGHYANGNEVALPFDATLIFPKKRPELVEQGKPLVYLGREMA